MKIAVLVSGGVDSSVALRLLKDKGYDLTAFYLKIWLEDELSFLGTCPWEEDLEYVRAVCDQAEVPLQALSLQKEYHDKIVSYTIEQVKKGRTPNPDILCNQEIKFGAFYDKIGPEYTYVASGHYAQKVLCEGDLVCLKKAPDPVKDQTYFLSQLTQSQLKRALFPLGHLSKSQVREHALEYNLPNKNRKDSQGVCFLGKLKFSEFIRYHIGDKQGDIIEYETNTKLGEHKGFWYYTIGQRQGIGLSGGPWYVVAKDIDKNRVYISKDYYSEDKFRDEFIVSGCNWIITEPQDQAQLHVKLRHGIQEHECTLTKINYDLFRVRLRERDQGIAPGQFAVFYDKDICLGGGVIDEYRLS